MEQEGYTLLMVEDEKWIRLGVRAMVDNERIATILEAQDGEEGLALWRQHKPQIVLSDIRLPGKDGCTMCEEIHAADPATRIVLLTGYNDFEYARRALGFRAVDYLLKPVDKALLNNVLDTCIKDLDKLAGRGAPSLRALCEAYATAPENEAAAQEFAAAVQSRVGLYRDFFLLQTAGTKPVDTAFDATALAALQRLRHEAYFGHTTAFQPAGRGPCLLVFRRNDLMGQKALGEFVASHLKATCPGVRIAVSEAMDFPSDLPRALEQTDRLFKDSDAALLLQPPMTDSAHMAPLYAYRRAVLEAVQLGDEAAIDALTATMEKDIAQPQYRMSLVGVLLGSFLDELAHRFGNSEGAIPLREAIVQADTDMHSAGDSSAMVRIAGGAAAAVCRIQNTKDSPKDAIAAAVRQIEENYNQKLSLGQLAAAAFMSEAYFSSLFKKTMGVPLVQYITEVRMRKAKELLAGTDLRITEVAQRVGYTDAAYFTKVFKRTTGENPTDYRQTGN